MQVRHGFAAAHRYTPKSKALQVQVVGAVTQTDATKTDTGYADRFSGSWALVAPPASPDVDGKGNISGRCELVTAELGDQQVVLGERDVRWSKYAQDVKQGEVALLNRFGQRLYLGEKFVSVSMFGGAITADKDKGTIGITGMPAVAGGAAPYITLDRTGVGLVSSTGQASLMVKAGQVTLSGATASIDAGSVALGKGAVDGVVLSSLLLAQHVIIMAWANTHTHPPGPPGPPVVPLVLSPLVASTRVKAAL